MFRTVGVRFIGQALGNEKDYSYLTDILDLTVGDTVVADTVGDTVVADTVNGYKTAKITTLCSNESDASRWIVCKVNIEAFKEKLDELKRKQFILRQMKDRLDQVDLLARCEAAAKVDSEMARLVEALKTTKAIEVKE